MVILFYQWGKLLEQTTPLVESITDSLEIVKYTCGYEINGTQIIDNGGSGLIPVAT